MAAERAARGQFFLVQHVDPEQDGREIRAIGIIGRERGFDAEPSTDRIPRSDDTGTTLDYAYELQGDTLTIRPKKRILPRISAASSATTATPWTGSGCTGPVETVVIGSSRG